MRLRPTSFGPLLLALAASLATPALAERTNRGMEPTNQPVVQRTDYVFDAAPDSYGALAGEERQRILGWFDAIKLGYGDRVSIASEGGYGSTAFAGAVSALIGRYGLLLSPLAPATAGPAQPGTIRIVVSRATASVPDCPDWKGRSGTDFQGGLSYNYGCASNSNLAAMIADPVDLVEGRTTASDLTGDTTSRAVKVYRETPPTGAGGLK